MTRNAPGPLLLMGLGLCALAFSTLHPLVVGAVLVAALLLLAAAPPPRRGILIVATIMGLGVAVLNPFVQASGDLILVEFPGIPLFDTQVTLEEVVAGLALGARAAAVILIVMSVLALADPDRLLRLAGRLAPRSALAGSVAARMVPTLRRDAVGLVETLRLRGRSPTVGRWTARVRAGGSLAVPLVGSALERSLDVAAAMAARGYGAGRPTRPPRTRWRGADRAVALAGSLVCALAAVVLAGAVGAYVYYPTMASALAPVPVAVAAATVIAATGAFVAMRR